MRALVFDCDGVLAESERDGHLVAFNEAFAEAGLPVRWSEAEYAERLRTGGGKERIAQMLTPAFVREHKLPTDPDAQAEWIARLHARKTAIFRRLVDEGGLEPRPGVLRLADEAHAAGWSTAVVSTSAEESVRAVLGHVAGPERAERFLVVAGDAVPAKKPDPAVYEAALRRLGAGLRESVAIEDSRIGLLAAVAAGVPCLITVSSFTRGEDFSEAALVTTHLGDPGNPLEVLADPRRVAPRGAITLAELEACLGG
jgi:HAD superfamily hydrolase (TIGR01509 family)